MPITGAAGSKTFQRTDGTRSGATVWQEADAAGVDIVDTDHDTHDQDIAAAINTCLFKDGGNTATADIPMGGNKFTGLGDAEATDEALTFDQAQDNKHQYIPTVGGTGDVITLTSAVGLTVAAYAEGQTFYFKASANNTGSVTVAIDGLGATTVKRFDGTTNLAADDIRSGSIVQIKYDGTNFQLDGAAQTGAGSDILARVLPAGAEMFWGLETIPAGWSKANGQALTKTDVPELDAAYFKDGYPYGASSASLGVGTLNLPPLAGTFIRVVDDGAGIDPDAATRVARGDGTAGDNVGTGQSFALEAHGHTVSDVGHTHGPGLAGAFYQTAAPGNVTTLGSGTGAQAFGATANSTTGIAISDGSVTGATTASSETRPKNIYQYLIVLTNPTAASAASVGLFGFAYSFDTATADADPGSGFVRFNNATLANATEMYIDDLDAHGADVSDAILTWDDSDSTLKGQIKIAKVGAPTNFAIFNIDGTTVDATGYAKVQIAHVDGGGSFSASDNISVEFTRTGDKGDAGDSGFKYNFDSSTDTSTDPGTGDIRFNNAAFASVTEIAIDDLTAETGNPDLSAFIATWDDPTSTISGFVTIQKASAKQNFVVFNLTGLTDQTGFTQLTVTHNDSSGSFSDTDELSVFYSRTGDKGDTGAAGAAGVNNGLLYTYSTTTDTGADPGAGLMRGNSLTFASITQWAFDDTSADTGNPDVSALIATWDDSTNTNKGQLLIKKQSAPENFVAFDITSLTDQTGYTQIGGTVSDSAGSWSDTDTLTVEFSRSGDAGTNGTNGTDGISGGLYFKYDSSVNTAADPGSGHWRANNATLSAATQLAISDTLQESGNPDISAFIATWDDSTNTTSKGSLIVKNRDNPEEFVQYNITSITDQGVFNQIAVTGTAGSGSLTDEDDTIIEYTRTGDKGADGAGAGDVVGPASATDNAIVRYDTTTGKLVQDSGVTLDDNADLAGIRDISATRNQTYTGYQDLTEIATPADPGANVARLYSKDVSGTTKLHFKRGSDEILIAEGSVGNTLSITATNDEGGALAAGDVVTVDTVTPWNISDARPNVQKADSNTTAMPAFGVVSVGGADGAEVTVITYGEVTGLDTSSFSARDRVYVDHATAGALTATRPEAATQDVQAIGTILRSHVTAGVLFVSGANRSNDIPNLQPSDRFRIADATDDTKLVDFDVSGVTTATTRTITVPDHDVKIGTESFIVAASDETSDLATGTAKVTFRMPYAFTVTEVRASVATAPTGSGVTVDINEGGTTILSTKLTIDATEKTSESAATPPVISDSSLADDAEMTIDIDAVGSTIAGSGLKVTMIGYQT